MPRPRFAPGTVHRVPCRRPVGIKPVGRYLASRLSLSLKWVVRLLEAGCVSIDGAVIDPEGAWDFQPDTVIEVRFPDNWPPHMQPMAMDLRVLHEDADILVLDKPPGIIVHPARGHMDNYTLQNGVFHHCRDRLGAPDATLAPAHRLDRDTSGVIIFGLTRAAYTHLTVQFMHQKPHKEYLAVVEGTPDFADTHVNAPLGIDPANPTRGAVVPVHEGGKEAATDMHVIEKGSGWAFVRAVPRTGRPHQVRLHLAHLGLPVIGDRDYHPAPERHGCPRQALHAAVLKIRHPRTDTPTRFEALLPRDMADLLERLRACG